MKNLRKKVDNADGTYTVKIIYEKPLDGDYLSSIEKFDRKDMFFYGEYFYDNNFSDLALTLSREYQPNGFYFDRYKASKPNKKGALSSIEKHDDNERCYFGEYYKDSNFKDLYYTQERKYSKNGSYIDNIIYQEPDKFGWFSIIEKFDKNNRYYYGTYYKDNNFKEIGMTRKRINNKDGSYTEKTNLYASRGYDWLSKIEKCDKNDDYYCGKFYSEQNFKKLIKIEKRVYEKDGSYSNYFTFSCPDAFSCLAQIDCYNKDGQVTSSKSFKDKNFKTIHSQTEFEYLENNKTTCKCKSTEFVYVYGYYCKSYIKTDVNNELSITQYYFDDNFTDLRVTVENVVCQNHEEQAKVTYYDDAIYEYCKDKSYIEKIKYKQLDNEKYNLINFKNNIGKIYKREYYSDCNFQELIARDLFEYYNNGTYIIKRTFNKSLGADNLLSGIEYYRKNDNCYKSLDFKDKNFEKLKRKNFFKHINNNIIRLTLYSEPFEGKYYSEISKIDKNRNLIYNYQYKFGGILVKIIYWLSL